MTIHIGADHAGYNLKEILKPFVQSLGYTVVDHGAFDENLVDNYPDFIEPVAQAVADDNNSYGIILGGSGQGEAMDANRFAHVRAAEYYGGDLDIVKIARQHNDANILSIGARFVSDSEAMDAVKIFLETSFSSDKKYEHRIEQMDENK